MGRQKWGKKEAGQTEPVKNRPYFYSLLGQERPNPNQKMMRGGEKEGVATNCHEEKTDGESVENSRGEHLIFLQQKRKAGHL